MIKKFNQIDVTEELLGFPDPNMQYEEHADVGSGSWILVIRTIPVEKKVAPKLYGIYWGMPKDDKYGRQCCLVHTKEDVTLLNHEYTVISEEKLKQYKKELDYRLHKTTDSVIEEMNMALIEQGRALYEEEREVIWALQLDGLTETQACEEYFLSKHTNKENMNIWYYPSPKSLKEIEAMFGSER